MRVSRLTAWTLRYLGGDCTQTTQNQNGSFICKGNAGVNQPVRIVVREQEGSSTIFLDTGDPASVEIGDVVFASAAYAGLTEFA